ncbi:MAG: hypothetical protein KME15_28240 [Drouetiella hepatica Uher 2000/2452]|jgi:hypothetical protein|uniref:Uncharacterized protein n=1 Tax=Drouetiella hepatica Uher 2000/2452 TaxID=904376 RepID=A0A951UR38_9CYAN|nr:hypothetical protein [Drouetiella hepatica Uher 2000/2452]
MSIQKFPLATVNKIRRYIQDVLALADTEQRSQVWADLGETEEPPEPESLDDLSGVFTFGGLAPEEVATSQGRWQLSTVNPAATLLKLSGLRLKSELRWVSYLYRAQQEGRGLVVAVPESLSTISLLEKPLAKHQDIDHPPQPEGALDHFMDAIEGDRSPGSFLLASLLHRELQEFGALGKRCNWSHHRLVEVPPPQVKWRWQGEQPKDWSAKVKVLPDGQAATEFFTCRVQNPIALYRHLDQFPAAHYNPSSLDKAIAIAYK